MNTSQIRFVLTTNATWAELRDPVLIQRCPRRTKPPTPAQLEARRKFVERYAKPHKKTTNLFRFAYN